MEQFIDFLKEHRSRVILISPILIGLLSVVFKFDFLVNIYWFFLLIMGGVCLSLYAALILSKANNTLNLKSADSVLNVVKSIDLKTHLRAYILHIIIAAGAGWFILALFLIAGAALGSEAVKEIQKSFESEPDEPDEPDEADEPDESKADNSSSFKPTD